MYVCVHECVCVSVSVCVGFSWKASEETNEIILLLFIGKECSVLGGGGECFIIDFYWSVVDL